MESQETETRIALLSESESNATPPTRQECSANATKQAALGDFAAAIDWCSRALELLAVNQPTSPSAAAVLHHRRAEYATQVEAYTDALSDLESAIQGFSTADEARKLSKSVRLKCHVLIKLDREDEALDVWKTYFSMQSTALDELAFRREFSLPAKEGDDGNGRYDEVLQSVYRRDFGNAISHLTKLMNPQKTGKIKSKDPVLNLLRCRCRMELSEFEGAVADAERVITLLPTATEAYRWLSQALIALKEYKQASRVCKAGLSVSPEDEALLSIQVKLQARKPKKKVKETPPPAPASDDTTSIGVDVNEEQQEPENPAFEQLRELKKLIKADKTNAHLYCRRARIRLDLHQFEQAQEDAAEAIKIAKDDATGYLLSCEALYAMRRYAKALKVCEQGLRCVPTTSEDLLKWETKIQDALINPPPEDPVDSTPSKPSRIPKAVAARRQQKAQRAVDEAQGLRIKCFEKAVELSDDRDFGNAVYWLNKAESYEAAGTDCRLAEIYSLRATCRYELKQYEHVMTDAEKAIQLDPSNASSHRSLVLSLRARGHMEKARVVCAAALELHVQDESLLSLQRSLVPRPRHK